jgi:cyclopropane-fatty-acyl-phospholipid synthase
MEKVLEKFVKALVRIGRLDVVTANGRRFSAGDGRGPPLTLRFMTVAAELRFLRDPELAFGELYMDDLVRIEDGSLYDIVELGLRNTALAEGSRWVQLLAQTRIRLRRLQQRNDTLRSRHNVAHHYDIDSRLYALFLDSDRQYSCAYFEDTGVSLEDAQVAKKRHIAAKLAIQPGQRVLDIGCGWGGLGLYLARYCQAQVKGITLSTEQLGIAQSRAEEAGLASRAAFSLTDYRELKGRFDRIVSVGMFEHVGVGYYDAYFRKVAELLDERGVALIHTIGRTDGPGATNPWIAKYIFPGGYIPAMSEVLPAIERAGLIVTDIEVLRLHYAETLKAWRERFMARREEAAALYDERFCRMWEFYLCGSEAVFRLGQEVVFQFQIAKRVDALPMTRDYIADRERQLRHLDSMQERIRLAGE